MFVLSKQERYTSVVMLIPFLSFLLF